MKKQITVTCPLCRKFKGSPRSLRAHWCPSKPAAKGNKKHSARLTKEEWQQAVDYANRVIGLRKMERTFVLTPTTKSEIILSALGHFTDSWITKECRRLHRNGTTQVAALKECFGSGGASYPYVGWRTCPKGLNVGNTNPRYGIITWSEMIPHVWPPKVVKRKPIRGRVKADSAWSAL